jgi:hypothetical protein
LIFWTVFLVGGLLPEAGRLRLAKRADFRRSGRLALHVPREGELAVLRNLERRAFDEILDRDRAGGSRVEEVERHGRKLDRIITLDDGRQDRGRVVVGPFLPELARDVGAEALLREIVVDLLRAAVRHVLEEADRILARRLRSRALLHARHLGVAEDDLVILAHAPFDRALVRIASARAGAGSREERRDEPLRDGRARA